MTLYKNVDGVQIKMSPEEEAHTRAYWALNDQYPLYTGSIAFDGLNAPYVLIDQARINHKELLTGACDIEMKELTKQIEIAQEDGLDTSALFAKRKALRSVPDMDLSGYNTIDELIASVPQDLKKYWQQ